MLLKKYASQLFIRTIFLLLSLCLLTYLFYSKYWVSSVFIALLIAHQIVSFYKLTNKTNKDLSKFLDAIRYEDYSIYFDPNKKGKIFSGIYDSFNEIIKIHRRNEIEKEALFQQFKTILGHINHGIISINEESLTTENKPKEIVLINQAATKLLNIPQHKYWHRLKGHRPVFCEAVRRLKNGGKQLVTLKISEDDVQLALEIIKIKILDSHYIIISFQDIKSEIEQKETEAWHKLIRVLAHEMLNSFTPVSSLADTIKEITENSTNGPKEKLDPDSIKSVHLAASTIKKRSDGLLEFVNDYRLLTEIPHPNLKLQNINQLFEDIGNLMGPQLKDANIMLNIVYPPKMTTISLDKKMIEQVLINLFSNSINALENTENPKIWLSCTMDDGKTNIQVTDNGKGIPSQTMDKIFIPFFTTRKNGSGIGLSLSKNIMTVHGGRIKAKTENNETVFSLIFPNGNNQPSISN